MNASTAASSLLSYVLIIIMILIPCVLPCKQEALSMGRWCQMTRPHKALPAALSICLVRTLLRETKVCLPPQNKGLLVLTTLTLIRLPEQMSASSLRSAKAVLYNGSCMCKFSKQSASEVWRRGSGAQFQGRPLPPPSIFTRMPGPVKGIFFLARAALTARRGHNSDKATQ